MATITGMTSAAMDAIAAGVIVGATVNGSGDLILTKHDGSTIDAGHVVGATGATGANGSNGVDGNSYSLDQLAGFHPTAADWSNNSHKITSLANGSSAQDAAAFGQIMPKTGGTFTGAVVEAAVALTFATTITVNAALGNTFRVTLTASTGTLDVPSNPTDNQKMIVEVKQDATGSRTMAYNAAYQFTTALPSPTLSTAANAVDILVFIYNSTSTKWRFMGALLGYT
jgi:hypothetical protein